MGKRNQEIGLKLIGDNLARLVDAPVVLLWGRPHEGGDSWGVLEAGEVGKVGVVLHRQLVPPAVVHQELGAVGEWVEEKDIILKWFRNVSAWCIC